MRTLVAGVLTAAALVALLVGWFGSGWAGVHAEQRALRDRPRAEAEATARALASDLSARLEQLRQSENDRPYYHYGNLFHDPRGASQGLSVAPSPLASGPSDALVRGHFQIDAQGRVSVPTINDQVPELSDPTRAQIDGALRAQVAMLEPALLVLPARGASVGGPLVAMADTAPEYEWVDEPVTTAPPTKKVARSKSKKSDVEPTKVVDVSQSAYAQNMAPEQVYNQVKKPLPAPQQVAALELQEQIVAAAAPAAPPPGDPVPRRRRRIKVVKPAPAPPASVQVTVAPLEWRPTAVDGEPAIAAVRRVDTPDGNMTQGFVVLASSATEWLGERASARGARIVARAPGGGTAVAAPVGVPGWYVTIDAGAAIAAVESDAAGLERAFLGRFVPIALLAMLCGALVVLVVARAEKLARERARFAAAAAHELRTPLAGLQLYGDMLADGLGDPGKARDYARRMAEEASRLGRVVSNVLGFSQLERGNLSVHATDGDVAAAVRAACERARPTLERAGVALEVAVPDGALAARFDSDALARVIGNLLDNAEKYGRDVSDRRIAVTLAPATAEDGARTVEIVVADHGPGVAASALGRLFRPFVRGIGSDGPPGLGLGLALSRSMAHAMAGDLVHRATPGGGATFVLTLTSSDAGPSGPRAG